MTNSSIITQILNMDGIYAPICHFSPFFCHASLWTIITEMRTLRHYSLAIFV